jgi:hypothetical protein
MILILVLRKESILLSLDVHKNAIYFLNMTVT